MTLPAYDPKPFGKELINSALTGAGVGTSAMALYYLLNGLNTAKIPSRLLREPAVMKKPTAVPAKKKPALLESKEDGEKSSGALDALYATIGKAIPTTFIPGASNSGPAPDAAQSPTVAHAGWRTAANVAALLGGMYGGRKLVNTISQHKKKRDLSEEVDDARRQYFAALTGKEAAALDAAYASFAKKGGIADWVKKEVYAPAEQAAKNYVGIPAWKMMLLTTLGTGALGAHYAYNKTQEQSKNRNLQKAQQARARLKAMQETPWVDPAELEALSAAAK